MRKITAPIGQHLVNLIEALRQHLHDPAFRARHRIRPQDFTRKRSRTFPVVMLLILQKTVKAVQSHLQEFLAQVASESALVTPGGWTQARAKLKHTAFCELNRDCVLPAAYHSDQAPAPRRWKGHRLLAIDSSLIRLPNSQDIVKAFGLITVSNQNGDTGTEYPQARISGLYDVLNRIGLDARLEPSTVGEIDLACDHLVHLAKWDVSLVDRGFAGYGLLASVVYRKWLYILSPLSSCFPPRPAWFDPFQLLPRPLHFCHDLFDGRCPHEGLGGFVPGLQELLNCLL